MQTASCVVSSPHFALLLSPLAVHGFTLSLVTTVVFLVLCTLPLRCLPLPPELYHVFCPVLLPQISSCSVPTLLSE